MDRSFAAQRPRLLLPQPADLSRVRLAASRILRRARLRRRLAAALVLFAVAAGGWFALRDSPLVAVDHVQITGVHGIEAGAIAAALDAAARRQTTLHAQVGPLLAAVARYRVVREVRVSTGFPHTMRITVLERLPVATLSAGSRETAVAADGTLLGWSLVRSSQPVVDLPALPARRVQQPGILGQLAVLGAAPTPLAKRIAGVSANASGIAVTMNQGPQILFGDASRPHAKWAAAARVLADPSSAGASYIDVRMPDRPAAGGLLLPSTATPATATTVDPTAAALAATLGAAVSGTGTPAAAVPAPLGTAGATATATGSATAGGGLAGGVATSPSTASSGAAAASPAPTGAGAGAGTGGAATSSASPSSDSGATAANPVAPAGSTPSTSTGG